MSSTIRKCISFGLNGVSNPGPGNVQYVGYQNPTNNFPNLTFIADSGTRWVKIWVDLRTLWPSADTVNTTLRDHLDYQIALAKVYGCGVILTINHELPSWINESSNTFRMPQNTESNGPWCYMFSLLAYRYSLSNQSRAWYGYSYADVIEFCNEPNQLWETGGGDLIGTVAILFKRAKQIVAELGNSPVVGGPAVADLGPDYLDGNRNYYDFTKGVLQRLAGNGFYDVGSNTACLWTMHNYTDVTYDQGIGTIAPDRTSHFIGDGRFDRYHLRSLHAASLLTTEGWRGWPNAQPSNSRMFLTEGGAQREVVKARWGISDAQFEDYQAFLVSRNLQRVSTDDQGFGVEMMTNYLLITDAGYDTGLVRTDLNPRSVYANVWKPFPGRL